MHTNRLFCIGHHYVFAPIPSISAFSLMARDDLRLKSALLAREPRREQDGESYPSSCNFEKLLESLNPKSMVCKRCVSYLSVQVFLAIWRNLFSCTNASRRQSFHSLNLWLFAHCKSGTFCTIHLKYPLISTRQRLTVGPGSIDYGP